MTTIVPSPVVTPGSGDETLMRPVQPGGATFLFAVQLHSEPELFTQFAQQTTGTVKIG